MRNEKAETFTYREMNWDTLKIGPHTALDPDEKAELKETMTTGEDTTTYDNVHRKTTK